MTFLNELMGPVENHVVGHELHNSSVIEGRTRSNYISI